MLHARLLGQFDLQQDGAPVALPSRPAQTLLAYLLLQPGTAHRREKLAGLLWPDATEANARGNLRQALHRLRQALEPADPPYLLVDDLTVAWNTTAPLWLDIALLQQKTPADAVDAHLDAVRAYSGELLPGFYDDWVVLERERLQAVFERRMKALLELWLEAEHWQEALEWGERWIALGQTPEAAYRALMRAHAGLGDLAQMAAAFRRCEAALRRDLGVPPSEQTRGLYERLARPEPRPSPAAGGAPSVSTAAHSEGVALPSRYRLEGELGRGGMGVVYRAHDLVLNRPVAVKVLAENNLGPAGAARLLAEARAAAQLQHPHIVSVYDAGEAGAAAFIVMELVEGRSLYACRPLALPAVLAIGTQVCAALEHAHGHGIIHRDLKPENILLIPAGATGWHAKLLDFGLARSPASRLSEGGQLAGTVFFLAPELALGQPFDGRADLYALGVVLYEAVTGRLPFEGDDPLIVISQHLHASAVPPSAHTPDLPPALDALILRLLSKRPEDRPASADEVLRLLEQIRSGAGESAPAAVTALDQLARGRLVAREPELAEALAAWQRAAAGEAQTLLISGEPGIGKTRLVRELVSRVEVARGLALTGECYAEGGAPYAPLIQMLQSATPAVKDALAALPGWALADLVLLSPGLQARFPEVAPNPPLDPEAEQQRLFESAVEFCAALSARTPVMVVLEDAHWADAGTLALLRHLARRAARLGLRLLLVLTYREVDLAENRALAGLLADLHRERLAARLKLARFSREQTRELLAILFQEDITPEFLDGIQHEAEGNPFFVEEVCKALIDEGTLHREGGRWRRPAMAQLRVPQSIRLAIEARASRLPEAAREALGLAAIIGRRFDFELLRAAGDQPDEEQLLDALERAERAQLVAEVDRAGGGTFAFAHALIPAALADGLSGLRRRRLHRRVALALERLRPGDCAALAHHFAEAADDAQALAYYRRAGEQARQRYANEDAARFYTEALARSPAGTAERFDLLAARAAVSEVMAQRAAQRADVDAMLALAEQLGDAARRCDALIALAGLYGDTDPARMRTPAERAVEVARLLGDPAREGKALQRAGRAAWFQGDNAASRVAAEASVARFREAGLEREVAGGLSDLSLALRDLGDYPGAQTALEEALALSRYAGERREEAVILRRLAILHKQEGHPEQARPLVEAALAIQRALGDRGNECYSLFILA